MSRTTVDLLINDVSNKFNLKQGQQRGRPQESSQLQWLVTIWVLANQESYR